MVINSVEVSCGHPNRLLGCWRYTINLLALLDGCPLQLVAVYLLSGGLGLEMAFSPLSAVFLQLGNFGHREHSTNLPDPLPYVIKCDQAIEHILKFQDLSVLVVVIEPGLDPDAVIFLKLEILW